jgi:hypothetical protein
MVSEVSIHHGREGMEEQSSSHCDVQEAETETYFCLSVRNAVSFIVFHVWVNTGIDPGLKALRYKPLVRNKYLVSPKIFVWSFVEKVWYPITLSTNCTTHILYKIKFPYEYSSFSLQHYYVTLTGSE